MALAADNEGFLVGKQATDLLRKMNAQQYLGNESLRALRKDTGSIIDLLRGETRRARTAPSASIPTVRRTRQAASKIVATSLPALSAARATRPPSSFVSREVMAARAAAGLPLRSARGQFVSSGRSGADQIRSGSNLKVRSDQSSKQSKRSPVFDRNRRQALRDIVGQAADVDSTAGAVREVQSVAKPLIDLVRGDAEARREKREDRKAESRQKRSEKWYGRIFSALGGKHAETEKKGGGGILGFLASLILPLISKLANPFKFLGGKASGLLGGIGRSAAGVLRGGGFLGKSARFLARAKIPIIGTLLSGLLYGSDAIGDENNPNLSASQKRDARYRNGGRAAGGITGALIGGALGSFGGPIGVAAGAWLGGIGGEMLGEKFGKWTESLIDADLPGMISRAWSNFVDFVKTGKVGKAAIGLGHRVASAGRTAVAAGRSLLDRIGLVESGGKDGSDSQRRAFLASGKGSTASGKYQFTDSTFADVVAKHGADSPALAGLVPLAKAYKSDKRSTREKANDQRYSALFAAKMNPASGEAAMQAFTGDNIGSLNAAGIAAPSDAQIYSAHLFGSTSFATALQNDENTPIGLAGISAKQFAANKDLFRGVSTVGDLRNKINSRLGVPLTASIPTMPSRSPPTIGAMPSMGGTGSGSDGAPTILIPMPAPAIGQNIGDRGIANVITGGIGAGGQR